MATASLLSPDPAQAPFRFSVCCIVTNMNEYDEMKKSFEGCGFDDECEYLIADNTSRNRFDAYVAINRFLKEAKGEYIIIVHQDVRCIDPAGKLTQLLSDLTLRDPNWAVCGNAGAIGYHQDIRYIVNGGRIVTHDNLPGRVYSLDENMLIIPRRVNIAVSADLSGFHFYAADLCVIADYLGYTCYVIPFMVKHLSLGDLTSMKEQKGAFLDKYGRKLRRRFLQTPSTKFVLCRSRAANRFYNGSIFFLVKWMEGIKLMFKHPGHRQLFKKNVENE